MPAHRILLFDSGVGGLTVARAVRAQSPEADLIYSADNAAFPYGAWDEGALIQRIVTVLGALLERVVPDIAVIACNTASTLALAALRAAYATPFVGTVPAIKPAAELTRSGLIGILATPATARREYTRELIHTHAFHARVFLHGARRLAEIAEAKLKGVAPDSEELAEEIAPVFREMEGKRTDVVVLGCTHYPLLTGDLERAAPWPVAYIDPAPAIARRAADVLAQTPPRNAKHHGPPHGIVLLTASAPETLAAYAALGFPRHDLLEVPS